MTDLAARAAQLLYAYARAVDEGDLAALVRLTTDDITLTRVDGVRHGRDAFLSVYRAFWDTRQGGSKHVITNVQAFASEDGLIRADAYFTATMFDKDETRTVYGQYHDSMRDEGGTLRFVHKRIEVERE
jgi:3-phenylpropionate/cinnamic acid dioxygenase small subunit